VCVCVCVCVCVIHLERSTVLRRVPPLPPPCLHTTHHMHGCAWEILLLLLGVHGCAWVCRQRVRVTVLRNRVRHGQGRQGEDQSGQKRSRTHPPHTSFSFFFFFVNVIRDPDSKFPYPLPPDSIFFFPPPPFFPRLTFSLFFEGDE
jgi:hypothetical protein